MVQHGAIWENDVPLHTVYSSICLIFTCSKLILRLPIRLVCKRPRISLIALFFTDESTWSNYFRFIKVNHGKTGHNTSKSSFFCSFSYFLFAVWWIQWFFFFFFSRKYFHTHGLRSALTYFFFFYLTWNYYHIYSNTY